MWLFSKKQKPVEQPKPRIEPTISKGFFSTDIDVHAKNHTDYILQNAFPKTADDFYVSSGTGDSAEISSTLKAAYQIGQQITNPLLVSWYVSQGFIGYQTCALLSQQWLINKACNQSPRDACRNGYQITANDGKELTVEQMADIESANKKFKLNKNLEEFAYFNRVFGVRIAIFVVESTDPEYYEKPFNIDGVTPKSYKGISQVDPYWVTPELDMVSTGDPASLRFYEPTYWRIAGKRYHHTHLALIRYGELPDILKPSYLYGGIPLTQMIYERVYAAERTANEAPQLALTKRTTTLHTDVEEAMADQATFESKLQVWTQFRDNYGVKVLGTDETMEQFDTSLGDLDTVIMSQYQLVAAIARTPATKLLGTSPKGFNATGEFEMKSYHEELESIQTHEMQPLLERHLELVMRSEIMPKYGCDQIKLQVVWNKLDAQTEQEKAQTNLTKAQTYQALQGTGAIDGEDIRKTIIADPNSGFNGLESADIGLLPDDQDEDTAIKTLQELLNGNT